MSLSKLAEDIKIVGSYPSEAVQMGMKKMDPESKAAGNFMKRLRETLEEGVDGSSKSKSQKKMKFSKEVIFEKIIQELCADLENWKKKRQSNQNVNPNYSFLPNKMSTLTLKELVGCHEKILEVTKISFNYLFH
jgi:hypothetical protein